MPPQPSNNRRGKRRIEDAKRYLEQSIADVEAKIDALTYLSKNSKDEFKHSMYEIPSNREHKPVSPKQ
ncbi:hypothetical protein ABG808_04510 [Streptococcus iniae]